MRRAIYVGKQWFLTYGMTGNIEKKPKHRGFTFFIPDGINPTVRKVRRVDIYIPSEHQTRHCPKP